MKKIVASLISVFIILGYTSCSFKEEIYINPDGSGSMAFNMDASQLMKMAGDEISQGEKSIDSTINFKLLIEEKKDSIAQLPKEQQDKLKALEKFKLKMVMQPENEEMSFTLMTDFDKASNLSDMFSEMAKLQSLRNPNTGEKQPFSVMNSSSSSAVSYSMDDNVFTRNVEILDKALLKAQIDSISDMAMFFENSTYKLEYHFYKPIKSVSDPDALFSQDRKTVFIEQNFMEYLKNPESLNVEFILEE